LPKLRFRRITSKQLRYLLALSYKGTNYHGWQIQPNANTVQAEINKALGVVLQKEIKVTGSGRTDTGVHAEQQFAHFDFETNLPSRFLNGVNAVLPTDIAVHDIKQVADDFHVRYSAISRAYRYRVQFEKNAFGKEFYCLVHSGKLDVEKMNEAASILLNHIDYQSFSRVKTQVKTFDCTVSEAYWYWEDDKTLTFYVKANRFLRGMVRTLVGTLFLVGRGSISVSDFEDIIKAKDRREASTAIVPKGLYLVEVNY